MHVTKARKARTTRWVASAALLAGLSLSVGPGARADSTGPGFLIYAQIALSGDVYSDGSSPNAPVGWTLPKCWLQPTSGFGIDASTPDGFAAYMGQVYAFYHNNLQDDIRTLLEQIYRFGKGADPGIGLTNPPYNEGLTNGAWYQIACLPPPASGFGDYLALQASMGATNEAEDWFWLTNGTPPPGVQVMDPNLLAEYAAANTRVRPGWPDFNPPLRNVQTVNLPTLITNRPNANGFMRYTATATLPTGQSQSVHAMPESVTFSSTGPTSPSSVTCYFDAAGNMKPCQLTFLKSTAAGYTMYESSMWKVTWDGAAGEPGWTHQIGPVNNIPINPVIVQEIQSVVGH